MKIKKITAVICVICLFLNVCVVSAQQHEINYIKVLENGYMSITGTVKNGQNEDVFIRISHPDKLFETNTQVLEEYVLYQKQTTTDEKGQFEFKVKFEDVREKQYTLRIGVLADDKDVSESFVYYGDGYRNVAFTDVLAAQKSNDVQALTTVINTYYSNLYLDTPMFDEYIKAGNDVSKISEIMVNCPDVSSISNLAEVLEGLVVVNELKSKTDYSGMQEVFEKFEAEVDIADSTINKTASELSKDLKKKVYDAFTEKTYSTVSELEEAYTLAVVNTYLSNAIGADSVKKLISDNSQIFGINTSDYNLSDSQYLKLIGTSYTAVVGSAGSIKAKLDEIKNTPVPPTSGSSSGGGGGGGGGMAIMPSSGSGVGISGATSSGTASYPFKDMENHAWAKEEALSLYNRGILSGYGDGNFAPERIITREEFLTLIINGFGIIPATNDDIAFNDVSENKWYYDIIKTAVNSGIVSGMGDGIFGVGSEISRQDMVVMLYRALSSKKELTQADGETGFEDFDTISEYAKGAVAFAKNSGIVSGMGDGTFSPRGRATRAEAAVILYRALEFLNNAQ